MEYKFALIGSPVSHSLSKSYHEKWLRDNGLFGSYDLIDVKNKNLKEVLEKFKNEGYKGFNVTMPLKQEIVKYLDVLVGKAYETKVVNTVVIEDGDLIGCNTDGVGLVKAIKNHSIDLRDKEITIFGFGGAAKAIISELKNNKVDHINIIRRDTDYDTIKKSVADSDIIINATPVGMNSESECVLPENIEINKNQVFIDIVYNPIETKFLKRAKKNGCEVITGIEMLKEQAKESFEIWTGIDLRNEE